MGFLSEIVLPNGYPVRHVTAGGALSFDGRGWPWEWPHRLLGRLDPSAFDANITKTIQWDPVIGNLDLRKPWTYIPAFPTSCVRYFGERGVVNKVGHSNPGFFWWYNTIGKTDKLKRYKLVPSIYGTKEELLKMGSLLNGLDLIAVQLIVSCPNIQDGQLDPETIYDIVYSFRLVCRHPIFLKLSAAQPYEKIAGATWSEVSAYTINSVPFSHAYPKGSLVKTPVAWLEKRVGAGGGGISGVPAQPWNFPMVAKIKVAAPKANVIASSVMGYDDIRVVRNLGAGAIAHGTSFIFNPADPNRWVARDLKEQSLT
ncbi:MAG: hypothetical protein V4674_03280 [Patescibacteria group bacterium]